MCQMVCSSSGWIAPSTAGTPRSPSTSSDSPYSSRTNFAGRMISGRLYCTAKAMWKLGWFLRDFLYDPELFRRDEVDEKALRRTSRRSQDQPHDRERDLPDQP